MPERWSRIGRAGVLGLAWAAGWAVVWGAMAVIIGTRIVDPDDSMDEMWVAVGAFPGFLCGALVSAGLGLFGGGRRRAEWSLSRVGAWGAASGLAVGLLPLLLGTPRSDHSLGYWAAVITGPIMLMSAVSAIVSVGLARMATRPGLGGDAAVA